jgi:hypothetical protein
MNDANRRDLLELLDDRYNTRSTLITSQLPVSAWHEYLNDPTLADAILDRFIHNAHHLNLKGESLRKTRTKLTNPTPTSHPQPTTTPTREGGRHHPETAAGINRNPRPASTGTKSRKQRNTHTRADQAPHGGIVGAQRMGRGVAAALAVEREPCAREAPQGSGVAVAGGLARAALEFVGGEVAPPARLGERGTRAC